MLTFPPISIAAQLSELRTAMDRVARTIAARKLQAEAASSQLSGLAADLQNQQRLAASRVASADAATRRMRSMVTIRKLRDIADAQSAELAALQAEYTRLHMKTYPTFLPRMDTIPDSRI